MKSVAEILNSKAIDSLYSVTPSTTVLEAAILMADKGVGALLVLQSGELVGIVSERDYIRRVALFERSAVATTVGEIMTSDLLTVGPKDRTAHCMQLMTDKRIRHLPVLDDGRLVGLLSIGDLVKQVIQDQESMIRHLEGYIRGE